MIFKRGTIEVNKPVVDAPVITSAPTPNAPKNDGTPWVGWLQSHVGEPFKTGEPPTAFNRMVFSHTDCDLGSTMLAGCAATLCGALELTGFKSPHNASAISFATYGKECDEKFGAILVLEHLQGSLKGEHHVTTFSSRDGQIYDCLGGNQDHMLQHAKYMIGVEFKIIAIRWPVSAIKQVPIDNSGKVVAAPITVAEYAAKFADAVVNPGKLAQLKSICGRILTNEPRYKEVEAATGVRWDIVACIHEREASMDFNTYLQQGDPLFNREGQPTKTVHVPAGIGPFSPQTWVNAAIHAFGGAGAHKSAPRDVGYWLMYAENYNGSGYRKMGKPSPYIWAMTDQYVSGKYVADHDYSSSAVDDQAGVAAILKVLGSV